jgi:hypothetical protein
MLQKVTILAVLRNISPTGWSFLIMLLDHISVYVVAHPPSSSVKESTSPPSLASVLHASVTSSPASLASVLRASITSPPALTPVVHNSTTSPEGQ